MPPTEAEGLRIVKVDGEGTVMRVAAEGMASTLEPQSTIRTQG
jgi:hypothetical protein